MFPKIFRFCFVLILMIGLVTTTAPQSARAAGPWYVATTGDDNNDCLSPGAPCATINAALGKASAGDTINVAEGTYIGTGTAVVSINKNVTLSGGWDASFTTQAGASTVDGEGARQGMTVNSDATVGFFIIENGTGFNGGGISTDGTLTLNDSIVRNNTASSGGGGISNGSGGGNLILNNTTVSGNTAIDDGGGIKVSNFRSITMNNSIITGNTAGGFGGGISFAGVVTISNSTISLNTATTGGGIWNLNGILTVINSTLSGNAASTTGGGIEDDGTRTILNNSTVSGNTANNGGGINYGSNFLFLNSSTVSGNSATSLGGGIGAESDLGTVTLKNSILAGNTSAGQGPDCSGSLISSGYNLIGNLSNCTFAAATGDLTDIDPLLGPLQDNSGPTFTHALLPGSPAIDAGDPAGCTDQDGNPLPTDQRGIARPQGPACDIGAFELAGGGGPPPANDNFGDAESVSLPFTASLDITSAGTETNEPQACTPTYRTVWYSFTPAENMVIRTGADGSAIQANLTIYRADGPGFAGLTFWACTGTGYAPSVFPVEAGKIYYFQIGSRLGNGGTVQLNMEHVIPPTNDYFAQAKEITALPLNEVIDNGAATLETDEPQYCAGTYNTVWYSFTPAQTTMLQVDVEGSTLSANINIYQAVGTGITGLQAINCTRFDSGIFVAEAGVTYYLQAGGQDPTPGELHINIRQVFPPPNDNFADAVAIDSLPANITVDISGAGVEPGEPVNCNSLQRTAWYSFTPAETTSVRVDTFGSSVLTNVIVYQQNGSAISDLSLLGCAFWGGSFSFTAEAGKTYYLQAGGGPGTMQFHMAQTFPPGNDNFGSAETITSLPFTATVDATDATNEVDEPQYCTSMPATIWYSFTAPETTKLQLDTQGSVVSGNVNVYHVTGDGFPGLQFILCSAFTNRAAFIAEAGETYYFQVGGFGQAGTVQFNLSEAHTISGHLTNALTGAPLPGNTPPFGTAHLYRICGDGCLEFVNSQNTDGEGRFIFDSYYYGDPLPAGSYQITATASLYQTGQFGPFEFSGANLDVGNLPLTPPSLIRGRVVDARTGNPLIGAFITLRRCDSGGCFEFVGSQTSDGDGQFQFNSFYFGDPLTAGTYELEISATLYVTQHVPVTLSEGEDHNLGNVLIEPVPLIGSISGRLIDAVSGKPISQTFSPELGLYYCNENGCFLVKSMAPDAEGRFRFEMDAAGNRLIAGSYQVSASADQYEYAQTDVFEVGENMDGSAGDIRLKSFPVRFSDVQPCAEIPATGGNCVFTVKISNGTNKSQAGKTWSMANSALPGSLIGYTNFQIKDPQDLALGVGKSKVFRFQFSVPANTGPYGTDICTRIFVGEGGQAFLNTIGVRDLFCVLRNANGFTITASQAVSSASQVNPTPAATGTEVEPNDSCQTAQDIGAISGTFVMDGNLDSSAAPDVDFFRFSGTPNAPVIVDHEGQATGKGTLGDPYLGFFDSNCNLIAVSDDYNTLNSHLEINVPADGVYILAATSYPDFAFTGGGFGSYQLTVAPVEFISSISGVITDALNGKTLPGDVAPFTYARLLRCEGPFGCFDVNSQNTASDGSFHFTGDFNGGFLRTGNYMIIAAADQYQATETEVFSVGNGEDYAAGQIALNSYPIRFSDTQVCAVPSQGGLCDFKVKVTNGLATKFSGRAWSIIEGYNIGSFTNFTIFQADAPADITLASGKSTVLRFRFLVRGSVANGATICATVFAGPNPSPFFNVVGQRFLFCFTKGPNGFTLLSEKEMQSRLQHMPLHEIAPKNKPSPKK